MDTVTPASIQKMTNSDLIELVRDVMAGIKPACMLRPVLVYLEKLEFARLDANAMIRFIQDQEYKIQAE